MNPRPTPHAPRLVLALSSAVLLIASFPSFNQPWAAWIALVPWLLLLRCVRGRAAFWWSWLVGFLFFLGSIWWLTHVTIVGWIILCAYLAVYFGLFGWLAHRIARDAPRVAIVGVPALWTALEFARSHLLSGFGWNLLAYSQTSWRTVIQLADVTGAWGLSSLIVLVNVAVAAWFDAGQWTGRRMRWSWTLCAACGVLCAVAYGAWRLARVTEPSSAVQIAVVQGNIPQEQKWDEAFAETILAHYEGLTRRAAVGQVDLIVWPETSVPGYFGLEEALTQRVMRLASAVERPLLLGAPYLKYNLQGPQVLNRATLLDASGVPAASYDKLHLVPFGEFVPAERLLPWLRKILPPIGDFTPGTAYTVFHVPLLKFSVLICFEDIFPSLARRFVREGAELLVVITNDAWFGPTAAAYQHAQASAFRAVELRVPVVRAANTGWSGCIDATGAWGERVRAGDGRELFVEGLATCRVTLSTASSLYRRWGDWFAWLCVALVMLNIVMLNILIGSGLRQLTPSKNRPIIKG